MPRAKAIWIVLDWNAVDDELNIVYAATVKYELVGFLNKQDWLRRGLRVYKITDGQFNWPHANAKQIDIESLIGDST